MGEAPQQICEGLGTTACLIESTLSLRCACKSEKECVVVRVSVCERETE